MKLKEKCSNDWNVGIEVIYDNDKGNTITDYVSNNLVWFIVTDKFKSVI